MRALSLASTLAILTFCLVACTWNSQTDAFELPTRDYRGENLKPPLEPNLQAQQECLLRMTEQIISSHVLEESQLKSPLISLAALSNSAVAMAEVSAGPSYGAAANIAGWPELSLSNLRYSHNQFALDLEQDEHVDIATALWMIWPIKLHFSRVQFIGKFYRSDVVKLGAAGLQAQQELNRWVRDFSPFEGLDHEITKEDILIATLACKINDTWQTEPEFKSGESGDQLVWPSAEYSQSINWQAARVKLSSMDLVILKSSSRESVFTPQELDQLLSNFKPEQKPLTIPTIASRNITDMEPVIRALKGDLLLDGPIDMRQIGNEIDGDPYKLSAMWQYFALSINQNGLSSEIESVGSGELSPKDRFYYLIMRKGAILSIGYCN